MSSRASRRSRSGTAEAIAESLEGTGAILVWNPEFLREGFAVKDTLHPDRLVYGVPTDDEGEPTAEGARAKDGAGRGLRDAAVRGHAARRDGLRDGAAGEGGGELVPGDEDLVHQRDGGAVRGDGCGRDAAGGRDRVRRADRSPVPQRGSRVRWRVPAEGHPRVHGAGRRARGERRAVVPAGGRLDQHASPGADGGPGARGVRRVDRRQADRGARGGVQARLRRRARLAGAVGGGADAAAGRARHGDGPAGGGQRARPSGRTCTSPRRRSRRRRTPTWSCSPPSGPSTARSTRTPWRRSSRTSGSSTAATCSSRRRGVRRAGRTARWAVPDGVPGATGGCSSRGVALAVVALLVLRRSTASAWSADDADPVRTRRTSSSRPTRRGPTRLPALTVSCARRRRSGRGPGGEELEHAPLTPSSRRAPVDGGGEPGRRGDPHDVVDAWLASPGHRANLLDPTSTRWASAACSTTRCSARRCSSAVVSRADGSGSRPCRTSRIRRRRVPACWRRGRARRPPGGAGTAAGRARWRRRGQAEGDDRPGGPAGEEQADEDAERHEQRDVGEELGGAVGQGDPEGVEPVQDGADQVEAVVVGRARPEGHAGEPDEVESEQQAGVRVMTARARVAGCRPRSASDRPTPIAAPRELPSTSGSTAAGRRARTACTVSMPTERATSATSDDPPPPAGEEQGAEQPERDEERDVGGELGGVQVELLRQAEVVQASQPRAIGAVEARRAGATG